MQIIDNVNKTVKDDLIKTISKGDKISIAAACFSIYAYETLKKQLDTIEELRFIFTSPTFLKEKAPREKREFYIPQLNRERSLYGTDFEVKLRNELNQKAIARECADWIKKKVSFRSNVTGGSIGSFLSVVKSEESIAYSPLNSFTTADLGCERGNNIMSLVNRIDAPLAAEYVKMFDQLWNDKNLLQDVTDQVIDGITAAYNENSPEFVYSVAIYNIFNEFLADITEDVLANEATGFKETKIWGKLYDFQQDAALAIINKMEKFNGCILADSVGLGKTFTALAVIKYYELRNRNVLVLCPKKLGDNWFTFKENYLNNPIAEDRLRYDVLYHTDLLREHGKSGNIDLSKLNWSNYDLLVIDESHNFRNGGNYSGRGEDKRENRYLQLLNKVIRQGVKTKVLMLSATPVNNRFSDLRNQLELAYEGDPSLINDKLDTTKPIDVIFRGAQVAFNKWSKLEPEECTTENLLRSLDFDFFTMLDSVSIARSRKHIEKYYDIEEIGKFPERLKPINKYSKIDEDGIFPDISTINNTINKLNLAIYSPLKYVYGNRLLDYEKKYDMEVKDGQGLFRQRDRESSLIHLMRVNILKRLESSIHSFQLTVSRLLERVNMMLEAIENHELNYSEDRSLEEISILDIDPDDTMFEDLLIGNKVKVLLQDVDRIKWRQELAEDKDILEAILFQAERISPQKDGKLNILKETIAKKLVDPINAGNKKVLIFTTFSDTAKYLYENLADHAKELGINTALVMGSGTNKSTLKVPKKYRGQIKFDDINTVLTLFSI